MLTHKAFSVPQHIFFFLLILFVALGATFFQTLRTTKPVSVSVTPSPQVDVIPWSDSLNCSSREMADTGNWSTYSNTELGVNFKYPRSWTKLTDTQSFEQGDLIGVSLKDSQPSKAGGGDGPLAAFILGKPEKNTKTSLAAWLDSRINESMRRSHKVEFEVKGDLIIGHATGMGISCGAICTNQLFAQHKTDVWSVWYEFHESGDEVNTERYASALCGVISSLRFTR